MTILAQQPHNVPASNADLLAMLNLLSSPEKFKEKMAMLEARERECDEKIALAGVATEIVKLREEAMELKSEAEKTLTCAQAEAERLKEEAMAKIQSELEQTQTTCQQMLSGADENKSLVATETRKMLQDVEQEKQATLGELAQKENELHIYEQKLNSRRQELDRKQNELDDLAVTLENQKINLDSLLMQAESKRAIYLEKLTQLQKFVAELEYKIKAIQV